MKKIVIIITALLICILFSFSYAYFTYQKNRKEFENFNKEYEAYYEKEISGTDLATVINKVTDNNKKNQIAKDEKGNYLENESDSIKLDIYISQNDTKYPVEQIYALGTQRFVESFGTAKFKCTKIEYHDKSKRVKYLLFEQTSI